MASLIGIDVGGTFTDFFILDPATGRSFVHKVASSPENPATAIATGLTELISSGQVRADGISRISHGTTVGTNALIQRKGAKVALIVTHGFRDLLEIGRQTRPHLYSLQIDAPEPLVTRERRFEARERLLADGRTLVPLESAELARLVEEVINSGAEACAVCCLFSFLNPEHEQRIQGALARAGCAFVSSSAQVQPEFREYERMSTTVLNAYLQPLMSGYLQALDGAVTRIAPDGALRINQSSGGLMSAKQAARFPVRTALSGPAAGAVGAAYVARSAGRANVITLDMGGTSADVSLIRAGAFGVSHEGAVGGFPVRLPMVDVNAVGAGGGSVAWVDRDGLMKVGPHSAGARPGPACYGLGGELPTVTDANLLLGRLSPAGLLGRRLPLDVERARMAFAALAGRLGTELEQTAHGCLDIVVANMARAIRTVSVERGHDPQEFSLLAFGGGGPLHARAVAVSLGIREIIVPPHPGILCAQGLLAADVRESFVATHRSVLSEQHYPRLLGALQELLTRAGEWFDGEGAPAADRALEVTLDMRYVGQNYELSVPASLALLCDTAAPEAVRRLTTIFREVHERHYGTSNDEGAIETVNLRVTAKLTAVALKDPVCSTELARGQPTTHRHRPVHFGSAGWLECPLYERDALKPGHALPGPAIVEQLDTTTVVFPGDSLRVDGAANLLIEPAYRGSFS